MEYKFTSEEIDSVIAALDDDEPFKGRDGSLWYELCFMEKHGFDIREYRHRIRYYIKGFEAPFEHDIAFDDKRERALVLELRDVARKKAGLAPLTQEERDTWEYWPAVEPVFRNYDSKLAPGATLNWLPKATDEQLEQIAMLVEAQYPEVVRYINITYDHNKHLIPYDKRIIRREWINKYISNVTHDVLKNTPGLQAPYSSDVSRILQARFNQNT